MRTKLKLIFIPRYVVKLTLSRPILPLQLRGNDIVIQVYQSTVFIQRIQLHEVLYTYVRIIYSPSFKNSWELTP